jgi:hypothetical protein
MADSPAPAAAPAAAHGRLTPADLTFAYFCTALVCTRIEGREDKRLALDVAKDVRAHVNCDHAYMAPICAAFDALDTEGPSVVRGFELLNLAQELARFHRWRGGLTYDAFAAAAATQKGTQA